MVGILATQIIDVQRHAGVVDQAMKKFVEQIDIELADRRPREFTIHDQTRPAGQIDDDARQGFIERHIAVTVARQPLFIAPGFGQRLAKGDADIFDRVVGVDVQVALGLNIQINQAMPGNLVKHVIEKGNAGGKLALTGAIKVEAHGDLRLQGITGNFGLPHGLSSCRGLQKALERRGMIPFRPTFTPFVKTAMSRFWSQVVRDLTPYVPGEQPKIANLIKLNTNEHPFPPSPRVLDAIRSELGEDGARLRLYPDPNADILKQAIAKRYAVTSSNVFVGNGSDEVLAHIFQALLKHDAPILFPDITYSFYPVYCGLYGVAYRAIPLAEDFSLNPNDYCASEYHPPRGLPSGRGQPGKNGKIGGIIFPNPNAPTGRLLPLAAIEQMVCANPDCVVVVDEAYVDFGGDSAIPLTARYDNLLVVHTLSKSRSLAGLRVGYAVGHPALIEALERVKNSFNSYPLDRLAIVGAVAAIEDEAHFQQCCQAVIATRETLTAKLAGLGFDVLPSAANFIFARHPQHDAAELAKALREKHIIVRHFKQARIDQFLRITIGTDSECATLVDALISLIGGMRS